MGQQVPVGAGVPLQSRGHLPGGCLWDIVCQGASEGLTAHQLKTTWKRIVRRNWGTKRSVTLEVWEGDAQGEEVEVGLSGEEEGRGEACPASWTCLVRT